MIVDLEYGDWSPLQKFRNHARQLLAANRSFLEEQVGSVGFVLGRTGASLLHAIRGAGSAESISGLAAALRVPRDELLLASYAYDLGQVGCSTLVCRSGGTPLHARNLDWDFPRGLLRKYATVFRVRGAPAGSYTHVSWPGFHGVLTGVAKGRFSVAVNYVRHRAYSKTTGLLRRAVGGSWPVALAVQHVMEEAKTFREAVGFLESVPLVSPVLFSVAGIGPSHGAIIERTPRESATRMLGKVDSVRVTNHYVSRSFVGDGDEDLTEGSESVERLDALDVGLASVVDSSTRAFRLLDRVANETTVYQVAMAPASGRMNVRVPGRGRIALVRS